MAMTKTKYNVGDKVRILNVDEIIGGITHWNNGDITEVTGVKEVYGMEKVFLRRTKTEDSIFNPYLHRDELEFIEKVDAKPTKNQRISALESQVTELQAQVARLQGVERVIKNVELQVSATADIGNIAKQLAELVAGETIEPAPTPNELRKAVIAEARAFVAELTAYINPEAGGYKKEHPKYGTIDRSVSTWLARSFFEVKPDKREVTVVLKPKKLDAVITKAIAKCAPGDVFNADIGKAIALGRALGLDVSKFEQAVQPTEFAVGQRVLRKSFGGDVVDTVRFVNSRNNSPDEFEVIIDDTEAQYE